MKQTKVSVYVPVYGVEKYIEKCVRSLFEQTLDDLEYIFVDDCSPDDSIRILEQVLEEYPNRKPQVKIVRHEVNQGVCTARRTGIQHTTGEYIACCEPDDWVETTMYEELYKKAKETGVDMVACDHYIEFMPGVKYATSHHIGPFDTIMGDWIKREYAAYVWSRIIKRELLTGQNIYFPDKSEGSYGEDCVIMCQFLSYIKSYSFIPRAFYHYRIIPNSISHDISHLEKKRDSLIKKYTWIFDFIKEKYGDKYAKEILDVKLMFKISWLRNRVVDEFYGTWPEANQDSVLQRLHISIGKKMILWLAIHHHKKLCNSLLYIYNLLKK
ncbi:glycosyltransferase [Parabacteroides sp. GYB001]|mgnify:FL=1|uniref:glycosyltransferase family 2 protein n=1 Tax=Parabacteroides leei TaxID=2939491 RepID=UPI002017EEAB|nr:glycosyltransferase family 2 protein [Parabacteroides leei]MCL3849965.1 glycosyltransferase [Parabacteroides leei]